MILITQSGKEIQVPNDYTYMSMEKFAIEIYQQGREDAIDEFYSKCKEEYWFSSDFMNFFDSVREQLKEQKNE